METVKSLCYYWIGKALDPGLAGHGRKSGMALREGTFRLMARWLSHVLYAMTTVCSGPVSCQACQEPTDKTSLDERGYIPLSSVQSLYVVELKLSLCTRLARQTHARRMPNP
jgi:hypothetical protein